LLNAKILIFNGNKEFVGLLFLLLPTI